ncbi:hypothetical protein FGO68_gene9362 [Halteria grandinella]|uniref:Uncharacterized protein n=1 Tax=Halteria grandinella TaxID=5974 RepID=A0A8J8T475_HALGN|nr:hypothetical protein FGO68_gene9362 [Halteria grandinella]
MHKLFHKSCFISLLSNLDFQQAQILLYRSCKQYRQKLVKRYSLIWDLCKVEAYTYNIKTLSLFFRWQDPSESLFTDEFNLTWLCKSMFYGQIEVIISLDESQKDEFCYFPQQIAKRLRVYRIKIIGDKSIYLKNYETIHQRVKNFFGSKVPEIKLN